MKSGAGFFSCAALILLVASSPAPSVAGIVPHVPVPQVHVTAPKIHVVAPSVHVTVPKVHVATPVVHVPVSGSRTVNLSGTHVHLPASRPTTDVGLAKADNLKGPRPNLTANGRNGRGDGNMQIVPIVEKTDVLSRSSEQKQVTSVEKSSSTMKTASTTTNSSNSGGQQVFDPSCYGSGSCGGCFASNSCIIAAYPNGSSGYATCVANCSRLPSLPVSIQCGTFGICGPVATSPVPSNPTPSPAAPAPKSGLTFLGGLGYGMGAVANGNELGSAKLTGMWQDGEIGFMVGQMIFDTFVAPRLHRPPAPNDNAGATKAP